jgi:hypothetical protein
MVNAKTNHPSRKPCTPPGKAVPGHDGMYNTMGWDDGCHQALFPRLSAMIHRPVHGAA